MHSPYVRKLVRERMRDEYELLRGKMIVTLVETRIDKQFAQRVLK